MTTTALDDLLKHPSKPNLTPETTLITRKQAADILGVKPNTLAVWECTKRYALPIVKVGRLAKYRLSDVQDFIANNTSDGGDYA